MVLTIACIKNHDIKTQLTGVIALTSTSQNEDYQDDVTRLASTQSKIKDINNPLINDYGYFTKNLQIEGIIGEGGVGRVYLAFDKTIGRQVAVKEILDSSVNDGEIINSFIHEAKITGKLEHPGIIPIYQIGQRENHGPFYVMKFIKGITLEEKFKQFNESGNNDFKQRLNLLDTLIAVCEALAYAHSKGVIHRDIKPNNIIIGQFGETIILDWGLAQVINSENTQFYNSAIKHQQKTLSDLTTTTMVGTPRYMSPEQVSGHASRASDVYSLGVILFRIISGKLPYRGSINEVEKELTNQKPSPSPLKYNPSAPSELVAICEKAMEKSTEKRFVDAGELLAQLNDYRSGRMVNIYNYSKKELLKRFMSRNKLLVSMLSILLISILIGASFAIHYAYLMNQAKEKAESALVTITTFGERAQKQAHTITKIIQSNSDQLYDDLRQTADMLSQLEKTENDKEQAILLSLHRNYPKFESFSVKPEHLLSSELSFGWKTAKQKYDAPIAKITDARMQLIFRVPVYSSKGGYVDSYLEATMYPEDVIPALFPIAPITDSTSEYIWIIRNDGLIVYDKNSDYIGSNIFTDPRYNQSPSLIAFAQLTFSNDDGIGHYTFVEGNQEARKIASWDTIQFNATERWAVIVSFLYLTNKIEP